MFGSSRIDRERLARVPFGDAWLALEDPTDRGGCDPLDVSARMAMYRLLIERVGAGGAFGPHDELCPLWGYASQLAWQASSGRLGSTRGNPIGNRIDPASWWGACNYALSVVPYAAAAELGVVAALRFSAVDATYGPAIAAWRDAFAVLGGLQPGDDLDAARVAIWRAHLASIAIAVGRHARELAAMPAAERRFARGWVRMVDLFGAAAIRTDLEHLAADGGGAALPGRVLRDDDALADLSRPERTSVRRVFALADRPAWRWTIELRLWRRIMRTRAARGEAERLLAGLLGRGRRAWPARLRAVAYATLPACVIG